MVQVNPGDQYCNRNLALSLDPVAHVCLSWVSFQASTKLFEIVLTSSPWKYIKVKYLYVAELLLFTLNNLQDFEISCDLSLEWDYMNIYPRFWLW